MKYRLLTNIHGVKKWMKGEVHEDPLHPDLRSLLSKPGVIEIIPDPVVLKSKPAQATVAQIEAKWEEKAEEKVIPPEILPVDKPVEKEIKLNIRKKARASLLRKGKK